MKRLLFLALLAAMSAGPARAGENCALEIDTPGAPASIVFDPFVMDEAILDIPLAVRAGEGCRPDVEVEHESGRRVATSGAGEIDYEVLPTPTHAADADGRARLVLRIGVKARDILPPGVYRGALKVKPARGGRGPTGGHGEVSAPFEVIVPPHAHGSLAGVSGGHDGAVPRVDMGVLATGVSKRVFLNIRSNTSVLVGIESENGGVLRYLADPAAPGVPYEIGFAGRSFRPTARAYFSVTPRPSRRGEVRPLDIRVLDASGRFAGLYRDTISITIVAN